MNGLYRFLEKNEYVHREVIQKMERMHAAFKQSHPLPRQIIHRDMHLSNVIFKDDKLEGFIDFEILENNVKYLIYVIAVQVY